MALQLRLPRAKLVELRALVSTWMGKCPCMKKELESLMGKLQHACIVVKAGRSFLRRLFKLQATTNSSSCSPAGHCQVEPCLVGNLPGVMERGSNHFPIYASNPTTPCVHRRGRWLQLCGNRHWFQYMWPSPFQGWAIAAQEVLPIIVACMIWGPWWANNMVV